MSCRAVLYLAPAVVIHIETPGTHTTYPHPPLTVVKLMEVHEGSAADDVGAGIDRPDEDALVPEVAGSGGRL